MYACTAVEETYSIDPRLTDYVQHADNHIDTGHYATVKQIGVMTTSPFCLEKSNLLVGAISKIATVDGQQHVTDQQTPIGWREFLNLGNGG